MRRLLTGDPILEQRRQSRLLDRLAARYQSRFTAEIRRASLEAVAAWEITGEVPMPRDHYARLEAIFSAMAVDSAVTFGERIVAQGKAMGKLEVKETFAARFARLALQYIGLEAVRRRIASIAETTRAQIVAQVERGFRRGLGVSEIAREIRDDAPGISATRGALIARTETHGAANFGADQAARATGLTLRKEWVAAEDERTRPTHAQAGIDYAPDGPVGPVDMDQPFIVGGEALMFPGDPNGSPWNTINCRCSWVQIVVD